MPIIELTPTIIMIVAALSVGGGIIIAHEILVMQRSRVRRRLQAIAAGDKASDSADSLREDSLKLTIDDALKKLEERRHTQKHGKMSLAAGIGQAGLGWSRKTYYTACMFTAAFSGVALIAILRLHPALSLGIGVAVGFLLPRLYIALLARRRVSKFSLHFPDAVDLIVRGLKAGLPLTDSIRMISGDAQEPVRSEFKVIVEDQTMGVSIEDAVQRLWHRVPLTETAFFGTVIALQSRTGGTLSEALGNLSKVMRERKKLESKIRSMSSEAIVSAVIIGSLPIIVGLLVSFTSPDYVQVLYTTNLGIIMLTISAVWMLIGIFVMWKMIRFDF